MRTTFDLPEDLIDEAIKATKTNTKTKAKKLLYNVKKLELSVNRDQIIEFQFKCLKNGLNGIGIQIKSLYGFRLRSGCSNYVKPIITI